ncbi:HDIG domain-containing protein [Balneolaceae bacterium YR4-1]|uniref:HDIG domain-containing protein n=1 Tax=Halalkalibaculum roseum TaxID=2709311 RepID=A0A6M1SMA1_9BACT|nr:HD domain-containing protein [Halalkalibaculum roseum]NGP76461.1 HDIG domain-containing protein [Halalkalibaculum roseum]
MVERTESEKLLREYIDNENLRHHCHMVAMATEAYARDLNKSEEEIEQWWTAGLLHDLDWEKFPEEHPNKAVNDILPEKGYNEVIIKAIEAHAPERTGREPETQIERYLFACDELSGFMNAVSLMRPNGFQDMKVKSVTKKLKDKRFAESVPREDIRRGAELIDIPLNEHIRFLIEVFKDI